MLQTSDVLTESCAEDVNGGLLSIDRHGVDGDIFQIPTCLVKGYAITAI
jgi:hypothetical protein